MINPKDITLRLATDADEDFMGDCDVPFISNHDASLIKTQIIEFKENKIGAMAIYDDCSEKFAGQDKRVIVVDTIQILSDYQRQGIGSLVLNNELLKARERQMPIVLEVYEGDVGAISLYERLGFIEEGRFSPDSRKMVWRAERVGFAPIRPSHPAP